MVVVKSKNTLSVKWLTCKAHVKCKCHVKSLRDDENQKVRMVLAADAVVDPLAVVIKPVNTLVANVTVS
jgi:hypothetical protein